MPVWACQQYDDVAECDAALNDHVNVTTNDDGDDDEDGCDVDGLQIQSLSTMAIL